MPIPRLAVAALVVLVGATGAAFAAPTPAGAKRPLATAAASLTPIEPVCSGCGCRGGAGYRLPNGKCAPRR